jgi:hypothetical protein
LTTPTKQLKLLSRKGAVLSDGVCHQVVYWDSTYQNVSSFEVQLEDVTMFEVSEE